MSYLNEFRLVFGNYLHDKKVLPLSLGQYDIWLEQQLYPKDIWNHGLFVAKIDKELNINVFQLALRRLAQRHEVIRTIFPTEEGIPIRQLLSVDSVYLEIENCFHLSDDEIKQIILKKYETPFDLKNDIPYRFYLYQKSESVFYFQIIKHHIAVTVNGYTCFPAELAKLYFSELENTELDYSMARSSYSFFVQKQYEDLQNNKIESDRNYWRNYLSGDLPKPVLPLVSQKPESSEFVSKVYRSELELVLGEKLEKIGRSQNNTFLSVMIAAFQALLYRYTKQEDILIGIPNDERRGETKDVIGYTINTLPLRSKFSSGCQFSQLIKAVSSDIWNMSKHRSYPLSMIMDDLRREKGNTFSDLFKILVVSQKAKEYKELISFGAGKKGTTIDIDGFKYESIGLGHLPTGRFDLALAIVETSEGCVLSFHYNALVFDEEEIERLSESYLCLLSNIADDPHKRIDELSILPEKQRQIQIDEWNATNLNIEQQGYFLEWFEHQAQTSPEAIAIIFEEKKIDYATLNRQANQLARYLRKLGAKPETLIGIGLERSPELILSLLSVIKSGAAYLPLDPSHPKERLTLMVEDAKAEILIAQSSTKNTFQGYLGSIVSLDEDWENIFKEKEDNLLIDLNPNRLAYVLYTSGSTGKPKGVEIAHRSLNNFLISMQQRLHLTAQDRWLALTTISFDISNLEVLLPLSHGATIVLISYEAAKDPALLAKIFEKEKITFAQATPSMWQMLVDFGWKANPDLSILCGGEALSQTLANQLVPFCSTFWNMYGPTETTIWSSMKKMEYAGQKITIGRPIANTTFYILDKTRQILPIGVPGELHIGGLGLARGYKGRADLTNERFITSPFTNSMSQKLYKTGDLAQYLPNGEIEYLGRLDYQVKIHGYRIELGEIEETLKACSGIQNAIVLVKEDAFLNKRIIAYFTGNTEEEKIKYVLSSHLPSYMMPSAYVQLSSFPLSPNGKVDRKALPEPCYIKNSSRIPPRNEVEVSLAKIFEELLGIHTICMGSNFFSLGGHSLLAARIITKINRTFQVELPLKTLFEKPIISEISLELEQALANQNLISLIPKLNKTTTKSLSFSQQLFWFLDKQKPNSALYSIPLVLDIQGDLDVLSFQKAFDTIVQRHKILRTIFKEGPEGPQRSILPFVDSSIKYDDFSYMEDPEIHAKRRISFEAKKPFDLTMGPLFRFLIFRVSESRYFILLNFHHIIFDGCSIQLFLEELSLCYKSYKLAGQNPLPELEIQYCEYIDWQLNSFKQSVEKGYLSWWIEKLKDAPFILNLPIDKVRPSIQTDHGALHEFLILNRENLRDLKQFAQKKESTLFLVLLSVFKVFLYRYTGQNDIVIGIPVAGRTHSQWDSLIGCFVNTLPFRIVSDNTSSFVDLMKLIKRESLEAFKRQEVPFEKIVEKLSFERTLSHSPIFQVMFNMLPAMEMDNIHDLQMQFYNLDREKSHLDLSLSLQETSEGLFGIFEYNTDLFHKETIERMFTHFQKLVLEVLKNPETPIGQMQCLLDSELQRQMIEWNEQPIIYSKDKTLVETIEDWAKNTPEAIAIVCGEKSYSYKEMNSKANQIAHGLLARGVGVEDKVVICIERSAEFLIGVLGILKAGAAYVPMDPMEPRERLESKIRDLHPTCILSEGELQLDNWNIPVITITELSSMPQYNPNQTIAKEALAYIIYTSGSTGKPKGVQIEHKSINDRIFWKNAAYPLLPQDVMLHTYSFIFDGAIINYFWPLCSGSTLVIATKSELLDPPALIQKIQRYEVTTMDLLPHLLQGLLEEKEFAFCRSLKTVFSGGEALQGEVIKLFYDKCSAALHNTYGPTETTVEASAWACDPGFVGPIAPIGRPIAGAKLYILDHDQQIVPIGVPGELHIGGLGLARGYLNDPVLTADKFIPNPFSCNPNDRLYRTGDLVSYNSDGNIAFLGRIDKQVKIRGFRIDLREIESMLLHMDFVEKVIVVTKGDSFHKHLIAYVVLSVPMEERTFYQMMKQYLENCLPAYMIPRQAVILDEFPCLINGKLNYAALPLPSHEIITVSERCANELEQQLILIWKEILRCESDLNITDNFFEVGGNSLLAMRLITKIRSSMGISVPLIDIFKNPTIEMLAEALDSQKQPWSSIVALRTGGQKKPFFCVHPVGGGVFCYQGLAKYWTDDRPFYAFQARGLEEGQNPHDSIEAMASEYIMEMKKIQPSGPYVLGGWSFGGLIAAEMVTQLSKEGQKVALLVLMDTTSNIERIKDVNIEDESLLLSELTRHFEVEPVHEDNRSFKQRFISFLESGGRQTEDKEKSVADRLIGLAKANYRALQKHAISIIDTNVILIKARLNPEKIKDLGWSRYTRKIKVVEGAGDHWALAEDNHASGYAKLLQDSFVSFVDF